MFGLKSYINSTNKLQVDARSLVIVLQVEDLVIEGYKVVFEECFENTNKSQIIR